MHRLNQEELHDDQLFPDLFFGFNFDQQFSVCQPIESPEGVVQEVTRAIDATTKEKLPRDDYIDTLLDYTYNAVKLRRTDKYMATTVSGPSGRMRRRDVVDIHSSALSVLDELAMSNHPVAQAVAQLDQDYGNSIGTVDLEYVTTTLIKLTHWNRLRAKLASQVDAWRLGKTALS